jgi:hypothetical protein
MRNPPSFERVFGGIHPIALNMGGDMERGESCVKGLIRTTRRQLGDEYVRKNWRQAGYPSFLPPVDGFIFNKWVPFQ